MGMSVIFIYMYMQLLVDLALIPVVCRVYTCTSVYKYSCTVYVQCTCTCKLANSCNHTLVVSSADIDYDLSSHWACRY